MPSCSNSAPCTNDGLHWMDTHWWLFSRINVQRNGNVEKTVWMRWKSRCMGFFSSAVDELRDWNSVTSCTEERELKMRVLRNANSIKVAPIKDIRLEGFCGRTWWNLRANCFLVLASYCCDILERTEISGTRLETSEQKKMFFMSECNGSY